MSTARASQQAASSAPAARPITEAWRLDKDTCALYTQDPAAKSLAQRAGLRWMGEYYRPDGKGVMRLVAWQFAGPKEKVMRVLAGAKGLAAGTADAGPQRTCACGATFAPRSNRQRYCDKCARKAARERKSGWKAARKIAVQAMTADPAGDV